MNEIHYGEVHFEYCIDSSIENPCDIRMTVTIGGKYKVENL